MVELKKPSLCNGARSRAPAVRDEARRKRGSNREQKEANSDALRPCETIGWILRSKRRRGCPGTVYSGFLDGMPGLRGYAAGVGAFLVHMTRLRAP